MRTNDNVLLSLLIAFLSIGCTSIKTTQLFRDGEGKFAANCITRPTRGVPCKFKVETGVHVSIHETIFVNRTEGTVVPSDRRLLAVKTKPIFTDQVFMVHVARPLAGTLDMSEGKGYSFNNEGYLTGIKARVEDNTIKDISEALGKNSLGGILTASTKDNSKNILIELQERTIAVRDFSFSDPNWYCDMNDWINQYQDCNLLCTPETTNVVPASNAVPYVAMIQP